MRAMSLAADEAEGEQNEMRTLQLQLENTQKLVTTLSQQLAELRDQVYMFYTFSNYKITDILKILMQL